MTFFGLICTPRCAIWVGKMAQLHTTTTLLSLSLIVFYLLLLFFVCRFSFVPFAACLCDVVYHFALPVLQGLFCCFFGVCFRSHSFALFLSLSLALISWPQQCMLVKLWNEQKTKTKQKKHKNVCDKHKATHAAAPCIGLSWLSAFLYFNKHAFKGIEKGNPI